MNPNELPEPDAPPEKVALATLLCAASVAILTVPFAVMRAGPDWLEIPIVMTAVFSSLVVVGELFEIAGLARGHERAGARGAFSLR